MSKKIKAIYMKLLLPFEQYSLLLPKHNRTQKMRKSTFNPEVTSRVREILKEVLKDKNLTQKEMATILEITEESMSRVLSGKHHATIPLIIKTSTEFNANPNYIITGQGQKFI